MFWLNSLYSKAPESRVILVGTFIDRINQKQRNDVLKSKSKELKQLIDDWKASLPSENHSLQFIKRTDKNKEKKSHNNNNNNDNDEENKQEQEEDLMFYPVSCTDNEGIDQVMMQLKELVIGRVVRKHVASIAEQLKQSQQKEKEEKKERKAPIMSVEEIKSIIQQYYQDPKVRKKEKILQSHFIQN